MLMLTAGTGPVGGKIVDYAIAHSIVMIAVYRGDDPPQAAAAKGTGETWVKCDPNNARKRLKSIGFRIFEAVGNPYWTVRRPN